MSIYLFTVSNWSLLLMPVIFLADRYVLWLNYDPIAIVSEEVNRKCPSRNRPTTYVHLSTPAPTR